MGCDERRRTRMRRFFSARRPLGVMAKPAAVSFRACNLPPGQAPNFSSLPAWAIARGMSSLARMVPI